MSNLLLGIVGTILAISLVIAGAFYIGPEVIKTRHAAEAARLTSERAQIAAAINEYTRDMSQIPSSNPISQLVSTRHLRRAPAGAGAGWIYDAGNSTLYAPITGPAATDICITIRRNFQIPNPERIYRCDGSDHPRGAIDPNDPCCLGSVSG